MNGSRANLRAKIAALRAKTTAAGCSEAEALAAAEMAAKLMSEYGMDESDLDIAEASVETRERRGTWRADLSAVVAYCCNSSGILIKGRDGSIMLFVGRDPGPEIAAYLWDVCRRAVEAAARDFRASGFYRRRRSPATRRAAIADFVDGMVMRLSTRLRDLFAPSKDDAAREASKLHLARRFDGAVACRAPKRAKRFSEAAAAGWAKGADVPLHRGVGADQRKALPA